LNWDEASIGYNAYSILKTGKDEWGESLPFHFRSYGEYKLPAQIYASVPGVAIFGLNELGVRITPVVYGTLTVLVVYFLASLIFRNRWVGLASALLLAISPWHIHLTRASFESSFSVFWVSLGVLFLIKGFEKPKWWIYSVIPFAISIYTYNSARVFTPLFLGITFLLFRRDVLKKSKIFFLSVLFFAISLIPLFNFWFTGEATARLKLVSIMDDPGFALRINEARGQLKLPGVLPRLIHNKATHFVYAFGKNYIAHFSPDFLFINGAPHKQHHVQGVGELYAFQAPFLIIGLIYLFRKKNKYTLLLIPWILLAFVPVSITIDSTPNALRTLIAVVPYQIITAYGLYEFYLMIEKRRFLRNLAFVVILLVGILSMRNYLDNYYNTYPRLYSRDWQYGYKQVVNYISNHYEDYDLIVFSRHYGEPHMFTLFFTAWDPKSFQNDSNLNRFETYDWVRVLRFDKFYFPDLGDKGTQFEDVRKENPGKRILFIGKQGDFPDKLIRLYTIDFLNGDRAFEIVELK
jgi:4-amino-4-deoxy-L-arabinose transferase-like glycosyltransferase